MARVLARLSAGRHCSHNSIVVLCQGPSAASAPPPFSLLETMGKQHMVRLTKISENWGSLITYATLFGSWPTMQQLRERLSVLPRSETILRLAWCNAATRTWAIVRSSQLDEAIRRYLFPLWAVQFEDWHKRFGGGFLFHRYTVLWLLRHALVLCPVAAPPLSTKDQLSRFGEALLMANDLSAFDTPKPLPTDLAVAANMIPNTEYFSHEDYDREVARTSYLFNELAANASDHRLPAFAARVQELLGYNLKAYTDLAFASAMKHITPELESPDTFRVNVILPEHFDTTSIPSATAAGFLDSISATESEFTSLIDSRSTHNADLTIFRERPVLRNNDGYLILDVGFVLDKAGKGLLWSAVKNAPDTECEALLARFGDLFELYVDNLLAQNLKSATKVLQGPRFRDGAQAADAAILEGRTLILCEHKANTIKSATRYADDPTMLEKALEERFITGTARGRKGLTQLFNGITRISRGDSLTDEHGQTITSVDFDRIMPVLVHLDNILRTPGIPSYFKARFKQLGRITTHTVTPLTLLPVTELEELEGHLHDKPLREFLESFLSELRKDRTAVFLTRSLPVLKGKFRKPGATLKRFDTYLTGLQERLFPGHENVLS